MMLLINPPVTKPSEPALGIAKLVAALQNCRVPVCIWDANLEGLEYLLQQEPLQQDDWTRQAWSQSKRWLELLKTNLGYKNLDRYASAVHHLNRVLMVNSEPFDAVVSFADFSHSSWSPVNSEDLTHAAANPQNNPFYSFFQQRLTQLIDTTQPHVVGFSLNYLNQALCTFSLIGLIRQRYPKIRIVLGGGLVTSWMQKKNWRNSFNGLVDKLIAGPGEIPLLKYLGYETPCSDDFLPDYSSFPLDQYLAPGLILPYRTARGCYWNNCTFCPEKTTSRSFQPIPFNRVHNELHHLVKNLRPALIHFTDNALSPAALRAMACNPPGTLWYGFTRVTPQLMDLDFCIAMKQSGCVMLKLGLESGDDNVLYSMNKGFTSNQSSAVLRTLQKAGIATYVYLLFGTPWEDKFSALQTLRFVKDHQQAITFINPAIFNLPIGNELVHAIKPHAFYNGDLQLYTDFDHPHHWDRKNVRHFLDRTFKRDSDIAKILRRTPPSFTSNHAPFFTAESDMMI